MTCAFWFSLVCLTWPSPTATLMNNFERTLGMQATISSCTIHVNTNCSLLLASVVDESCVRIEFYLLKSKIVQFIFLFILNAQQISGVIANCQFFQVTEKFFPPCTPSTVHCPPITHLMFLCVWRAQTQQFHGIASPVRLPTQYPLLARLLPACVSLKINYEARKSIPV